MTDVASSATAANREFVSFRVGSQEFCIDIMGVREIRGSYLRRAASGMGFSKVCQRPMILAFITCHFALIFRACLGV